MKRSCLSDAIDLYATPSPLFVAPSMPIPLVAQLMRQGGFRHLPVVGSGGIVGVISDRDVKALAHAPGLDGIPAEEVMSRSPYVVESGTPLGRVVATMIERNIGSAIIRHEGHPVGIFTATDGLRALLAAYGPEDARRWPEEDPAEEDDRTMAD